MREDQCGENDSKQRENEGVAALHEAKLDYSTASEIVRALPAGLFIYQFIEPDRLLLVSGNPESERLSGIRAAEWLGREFNELWPAARELGGTDRYLEVMRTGETYVTEDLFYQDERLTGAFRIHAFRLPGQRLAVAFANITEQKQIEAELNEQRLLYADLIDTLPVGVYLLKVQCRGTWTAEAIPSLMAAQMTINFVSPRFCQILGITMADIAANPALIIDLIHPEERQDFNARNAQAMTDFAPFFWEGRIVTGAVTKWVRFESQARQVDPGTVFWTGLLSDITMAKQAEQALAESERNYRLIVEHQNELVVKVDAEGRFLYVSPSYCAMFGKSEAELLGRPFVPLVHEDDREATLLAMEDLHRPPYSCVIEQRALTVDGWQWFSWHDRALVDQSGQVAEIIGTGRVITKRKQSEEALRRREHQLQILARAARQINAVLDVPVILRSLVAEAIELTGAQSGAGGLMLNGEMVFGEYNHAGRLVPIDYRFGSGYGVPGWVMQTAAPYLSDDAEHDPHVIPEIQQTLGFRNLIDVPIISREGILLGCFEIHNKQGGDQPFTSHDLDLLTGLAASAAIALDNARMLAERKQAEETLRLSEERFRRVVESSPFAIAILTMQGRMDYLNPKYAEVFGYGCADIPTLEDWLRLVSPDPVNRECLRSQWLKALDSTLTRTPDADGQVSEITCRDGSVRTVRIFVNRMDDRVLAIFHDLTAQKCAEEEKDKLHAQLLQAQKMESVARLAGGVAHDFNNMLTAILGHAELGLVQAAPADPLRRRLEEIRDAAKRSANLTHQLLAFARRQTVAPRLLDLNETIEGMLKMLRRLIGENIDLAWLPKAGLWPVLMDPTQVDQILANLCVNSRDAIAEVGRVTIETKNVTLDEAYCTLHAECLPGDYVMLTVSDSGCGMSKEIQDKLFEPFFTTKEVGRGTGLGLATVYGIVRQNGGFINVYSEPGEGTTFRLYLPRHAAVATLQQGETVVPTIFRGSETVLLVEDEVAILNLGKMMLENMGYRVLAAATPKEALRLARDANSRIHLLMTDVVMPEMNGRELSRQLLALFPDLACLFTSGYTADVIANSGVLEPGIHFIHKPFSMPDLSRKIREALDGAGKRLEGSDRQV